MDRKRTLQQVWHARPTNACHTTINSVGAASSFLYGNHKMCHINQQGMNVVVLGMAPFPIIWSLTFTVGCKPQSEEDNVSSGAPRAGARHKCSRVPFGLTKQELSLLRSMEVRFLNRIWMRPHCRARGWMSTTEPSRRPPVPPFFPVSLMSH